MASNSLKFSFIPKSSFGKEESFIERKRPRSIIEFIASVSFLLSLGAYGALYLYNVSITKQIDQTQKEIASTEVYDQTGINKAADFRTRVELAQQLLGAHIAVSPILNFLTQNSLDSIYYNRFSFSNNNVSSSDGSPSWGLKISGEAPSYSSLAYQTDVLRKNISDDNSSQLSSFDLSNVTLTEYGTVTFDMNATFAPTYISYSRTLPSESPSAPVVTSPVTAPVATSTASTTPTGTVGTGSGNKKP